MDASSKRSRAPKRGRTSASRSKDDGSAGAGLEGGKQQKEPKPVKVSVAGGAQEAKRCCTSLHCSCEFLARNPSSVLPPMDENSGVSLTTFNVGAKAMATDKECFEDEMDLDFDTEGWDAPLATAVDEGRGEATGGTGVILGDTEETLQHEESSSDTKSSSNGSDPNNEDPPPGFISLSERIRLHLMKISQPTPPFPLPPTLPAIPEYFCDVCERKFNSSSRFDYHKEHHRKCLYCHKFLSMDVQAVFIFKKELNATIKVDLCEGCREKERRITSLARGATETVTRPTSPPQPSTSRASLKKKQPRGASSGSLTMSWDIGQFLDLCSPVEETPSGGTLTLFRGDEPSPSEDFVDVEPIPEGVDVFPCFRCPATFLSRLVLEMHEKSHLKEEGFICTECGQGFRTQELLTQHNVKVHPPKKEFTCQACGREFSSMWTLRGHERNSGECQEKISQMEPFPKHDAKKK